MGKKIISNLKGSLEDVVTAPKALILLWSDKFFLEGKKQKDVENELHKRGYNFGDAVRKALTRAKFLLIIDEKGERKFIQKYPYTENKMVKENG